MQKYIQVNYGFTTWLEEQKKERKKKGRTI